MANDIRVRYAPSPTGHLHIGNARTALFNYLFARHNKGKFIIRIEDTDTKRNIEDGERSQLDNLKWLGMDWDEGPDVGGDFGPYRQSERRELYTERIQELLDKDLAYESFLTEEELEEMRDRQKANGEMPHYEYEYEGMNDEEIKAVQEERRAAGVTPVVRFRIPKDTVYEFDDIVKGPISFESDTIGGDWVIQKRDGMPTYNFAVVVDDHLMKISHVLRGDDHIANTPKQMMIYDAFGWDQPRFGHMTLIINTETGKKLSKRDESILQFIEQYKELGYLPDAMFNFIALLGWSPVGEDEIFNRKELIKMFDENRLSKSPAKFDQKKLEWVNNQYVRKSDLSMLTDLSLGELISKGLVEKNPDAKTIQWIRQMVSLFTEQMSYTAQMSEFGSIFLKDPEPLSQEALTELKEDEAKPMLEVFKVKLSELERFTAPEIMNAITATKNETGVKGRKLFMPVRIATTQSMHGPGIAEAIELLGKKKAIAHLDHTLEQI
ncbi:glutamate--tRNA ligase [Companilactobacillus sp. RD055328]|uniref:glutamate--tRNA ligase n=1 Tax=Companilactobacillus sp. RD055328 TaxID=2916634 RepID=UPI001FC7D421|nr:glutamate--tRNA ligase [Companilactobacillus sp. RD055328]GKQ42175.1 glutamate--tRNA ligase [Companilactobacillus sp. RD055328]